VKWSQTRRSGNIEMRGGRVPGGPAAVGGLGLLIVLVAAVVFGVNPDDILQFVPAETGGQVVVAGTPLPGTSGDFISQVLADTEDTWALIFRDQVGSTYPEPRLIVFEGAVESACGFAQSAVGPFYCSRDQQVYLDLGFFDEMANRLGAPGDFAQAYVVAHEVGHHVQNVLGTLPQVNQARSQLAEEAANRLSVALELQADCYAGVWANRAQELRLVLDEADVREGLGAAQAVGDDRLQMEAQGYVVPDSFTHGTSEQRAEWFMRGLREGDLNACDTFAE
jgi:predicted metalloprotease